MNRDRYRTIFSKRLGMLVAVAETARSRGKSSGGNPGSCSRVPRPGRRAIGTASVAIAVGCALWGEAAFAGPPLPTGGVVTNGTGTISESGNTLTVNQSSQNLSANWQSFDIDAGHAVVFNQPNSSSVALNRVIGPEASSIYGSLSANGKVFLVNPNGVLFAPGSQVSVGGLAASTLSISDEDFAAGRYRFTNGTGAGSVVNQGTIKADSVALIAPKVINGGTISTPGGHTTLAAGDRVTVSVLDGLLTAQVDASVLNAEIQNHGQIVAEGGSVSMLAGRADAVLNSLINTDGVVQANSIRSENGKIYLEAGAGGTAYVNGTLDASAANGSNGGEVRVLGERVTLGSEATIDVSSQRSGGTALIGGDYRGKNPDVLNARTTTVEAGAAIRADGAERGGRVIVWSDDTTRFEGEISARGTGFAEVSGKGTLSFAGKVDTGGGTLLLDPTNITVQIAAGDQVNTFSGGQIATLLASNDVILNADNNITWNAGAALDYNGIGSTGRTLTLEAGNNIAYSGTISDSVVGGDRLNVVFNADHDASGVGGINIASSSSILTSGGDIVLFGGNSALSALPAFTNGGYESALRASAARGIAIGSATLNAGGGTITARGVGVDGISSGVGVSLVGATLQTNGSGAITIDAIGGAGTNFNRGIFTSAVNLSTVNGALTLQGIGGGSGSENSGMRINTGSTVQTTGSGSLIVNALGSTGGDFNDGVVIDGATVRANTGDVAITGTGRGTGIGSDGVELANSSVVEATSSGNVTLNGTSIATGPNTNRGVTVWLSSTVRSGTGTLTLQGTSANAAKGNGISLEAGGTIGGAGQSGDLTLTADTMNLSSAAIRGTGSLLLQPLTSTTSIGLGNSATGTLNLTAAELGLLQNGFSSIAIGRSDGSGAVDVRTAAFVDPVTIRTPVGSGNIAVNGTLSTGAGTSAGSITLQAAGDVSLNNGTVNTTDAISLTGSSYTVTGNSALTSNTLAFGNTNAISDTGTLTLNQTVSTTLANAIGGTGGNLVKAGANTLTLTGDNTYSGATTISAGTLQVGSGGTTGTLGAGTVTNNGTLTFNRSDDVMQSGAVGGTGNLVKVGTNTLTLTGNNTYSGTTTISAGTLQVGSGGTTGTLGSGAVTDNGTLTFNRSDALTQAAVIGGTGNIVKLGAGTVTLSGANTYSGGTTVSAGTLRGRGGGGNNTTITPFGSAAIAVAAGATAVVDNTPGTGYNNFNNDFTGTGTVSYLGSSVNRLISGASLSGFSGLVSIDQNVVQLHGANTTATLNVNNGANFAVWSSFGNPTFGALTGSGTVAGVNTGGGGTLTIGNGDGSGTFSGVISNNYAVSLVKTGIGTQTLTGANTHTGTTTVNAGTLAITNNSGLGSTAGGTTVAAGAVLDLQNVAVGAESVTLAGGALRTSVGTSSLSGPVALPSSGVIDVSPGAELTVSGVISGSGALAKSNSGTLVLSGANTYTGQTTVNIGGGTLAVTNDSALGSASAGLSLRAGGTLDLRNVTIADSIAANTGDILVSTGASTLSGNITGFNSLPLNVLSGAQLTMTGVTSTAASLVKNGGGTLTLTGNNTSAGATTINAGTVRVGDGGTTGTLTRGAVTVASGSNLVFDRSDSVSLSTLANNVAGITGAGNVTALIGGGFTVDRPITLSGANSSILLEAGKNIAPGDVSGGDVTLTSNISTSAGGTITIFSGNASTAAYEAHVSGATGATRYKTYNASASNTSGAISGTHNYYYRQQPSTLSVSGLTASKVYDGLLDATLALDSSAATVLGLIDGDTLGYGDLTVTGANFDNAHAGVRALNVSFGAGVTPSYASGGATWSLSGYGFSSNYSNATAGTITPRSIATSINAVGKTYDGLTSTSSTLSSPSGFVGSDGATGIGGLLLAFDSPNAGMRNVVATGTASLTDFAGAARGNGSGVGAGNEVAGLASDYSIVGPSPVGAVIGQAPLTVTANNDAKLISQSDAAGYNGASYSGFVHGETAGDLTGSLSITRTNTGTETAGNYAGVLAPAGYASGNYAITYVNGNYQILPAQQLLIKVGNVSGAYGTSPGYVVTSAQYVDGSGATLRTLTETARNGNTYTYSDGLGGSVTFTISPQGAVMSNAGYLAVGNYTLAGTNATITGSNFVGLNYVGNQTVNQLALTPNAGGVSKVYDGTTGMTGLMMGLTGRLTGDALLVDATGTFNSKNAGSNRGYDINNIALSGADAGNYYLTSGALSGSDGLITPKTITVGGITANDKVYDGTKAATLKTAGYAFNGVVTGDTVALDAASYGALFDSRNVGTGRAVSLTGLGLSGLDAGNYVLTQPTGLTANITPRPITITSRTNTKYYDATTGASAMPSLSDSLADGDAFTLFGQRYASAEIGEELTLIPFAVIDDGNGGNNYALTFVNDTTGVIQRHPIDVAEDVGSSAASSLEEALAAAGRSDRAAGDGTHRVVCASDDAENCLINRSSVPRIISSGIKLPEGVPTSLDSSRDLRW